MAGEEKTKRAKRFKASTFAARDYFQRQCQEAVAAGDSRAALFWAGELRAIRAHIRKYRLKAE